jgi:hypothetical protein
MPELEVLRTQEEKEQWQAEQAAAEAEKNCARFSSSVRISAFIEANPTAVTGPASCFWGLGRRLGLSIWWRERV